MKKMRKKRPLTLLEIMIVIFLIGLIGSVIGFNVKGSLDEGKAFRSEQGAAQIYDILQLELAKGRSVEDVLANKEGYLGASGLAKDAKQLLKDGWGKPYTIIANKSGTDIKVKSEKLEAYKQKKKAKLGKVGMEVDEEDEKDEDGF